MATVKSQIAAQLDFIRDPTFVYVKLSPDTENNTSPMVTSTYGIKK